MALSSCEGQLGLLLPATNIRTTRALRGVLRWETRDALEQYVERHGNLYYIDNRLVQVRPRQCRLGWVLLHWWYGKVWVLGQDRELVTVPRKDLGV